MKPATMAPAYVHLYPRLCEAARANGYALAIHGTLGRDFDLLAVPWTAEAADAETLTDALAKEVGGYCASQARETEDGPFVDLPKRLPHGRLGYLIFLRASSGYIDLSVTPRLPSVPVSPPPPVTDAGPWTWGRCPVVDGPHHATAATPGDHPVCDRCGVERKEEVEQPTPVTDAGRCPEQDCPECGGMGEIEFWAMFGEEADVARSACKTCNGTGLSPGQDGKGQP